MLYAALTQDRDVSAQPHNTVRGEAEVATPVAPHCPILPCLLIWFAPTMLGTIRKDTAMETLTLFSWGYWGWGSATKQLIQAVDAVETSRGYKPPIFVDIRISRSVRAAGFRERAFEQTIGADRYRWFDSLGNVGIQDGGSMRIKDPAAAETLLDLALDCARRRQRVIFFCSCEFAGTEKEMLCHRVAVAGLLLKAAARRKLAANVIEWPGGEPIYEGLELQLSPAVARKLHSSTSIPLPDSASLAQMAAIPWYSLVKVRSGDGDTLCFLVGPAKYRKSGWYLPQLYQFAPDVGERELRSTAKQEREQLGYDLRQSTMAK